MAVACLLFACSSPGAGPSGSDAGPDAAGADAATPDTAAPDAGGWQAVEAVLVSRSAAAGESRLGLTVWDANDHKVYEHMLGDFTPDTRVAVASASKLVSGLVIFDVIRQGKLTLDSTTGQVLGWTGPNAAITLRHLLSFTSGLPREAACTANPLTTLAACAATLESAAAVAPPGARFDYGSTHLLVAGRMAEVATGRGWPALFADTLRTPLGLPPEVAYFTFPRQATGMLNPLLAGGLRASVNEYGNFLALAFHEGSYRGLTIGTPALFEAQAREPFPDAVIGFTPAADFRYGLASWLICDTPAAGCAALASPGAFGFTPWYDREAGFYAILGMELSSNTSTEGVVQFAVKLMEELQPLIRAQFGH